LINVDGNIISDFSTLFRRQISYSIANNIRTRDVCRNIQSSVSYLCFIMQG